MFKIEQEGGGPGYLKQTTDSEFPRIFYFILKGAVIIYGYWGGGRGRGIYGFQSTEISILCISAEILPPTRSPCTEILPHPLDTNIGYKYDTFTTVVLQFSDSSALKSCPHQYQC